MDLQDLSVVWCSILFEIIKLSYGNSIFFYGFGWLLEDQEVMVWLILFALQRLLSICTSPLGPLEVSFVSIGLRTNNWFDLLVKIGKAEKPSVILKFVVMGFWYIG